MFSSTGAATGQVQGGRESRVLTLQAPPTPVERPHTECPADHIGRPHKNLGSQLTRLPDFVSKLQWVITESCTLHACSSRALAISSPLSQPASRSCGRCFSLCFFLSLSLCTSTLSDGVGRSRPLRRLDRRSDGCGQWLGIDRGRDICGELKIFKIACVFDCFVALVYYYLVNPFVTTFHLLLMLRVLLLTVGLVRATLC